MKGLIQRVSQASVRIDGKVVGEIDQGVLLLLGVQREDTYQQVEKMLHKVLNYRMFSDADQKMNLDVSDINGGILIVSQFTLAADTSKGRRPGFSSAAEPSLAKELYLDFVKQAQSLSESLGVKVATGVFAADMQVSLVNDGPVTFLLEV